MHRLPRALLCLLALLAIRCVPPQESPLPPSGEGGGHKPPPPTADWRNRMNAILMDCRLLNHKSLDGVIGKLEDGRLSSARESAKKWQRDKPSTAHLFAWHVAAAIDDRQTGALAARYDHTKTTGLVREERAKWATSDEAEPALLVLLCFIAQGAGAADAMAELAALEKRVPDGAMFSPTTRKMLQLVLELPQGATASRRLAWVQRHAPPDPDARVAVVIREPRTSTAPLDAPFVQLLASVRASKGARLSQVQVRVRAKDSEEAAETRSIRATGATLEIAQRVELFKGENEISILAADTSGRVAERSVRIVRRALPPIDQRWAVIIGVSQYQHQNVRGLTNLRFAHRDAEELREQLVGTGRTRWPKENVRLLTNEKAKLLEVRKALKFLQRAQKDDLVLIFFSGHGVPETNAPGMNYFLCHDTDPENLATTGFGMWEIDQHLKPVTTGAEPRIKARRVIVLADACHSGGCVPEGVKDINVVSEHVVEGAKAMAAGTSAVRRVLTSCKAGQVSQEKDKWGGGHGAFACALIQALKGDADLPRETQKNARGNRDGKVDLDELAYFVGREVGDLTGGTQDVQDAGRLRDVIMRGD